MSNQQPTPDLMSSRSKAKRDSTRILSNLSGDSRVVPARAKSTTSRNKIFALFTLLILLSGMIGAAAWFVQRVRIPASSLVTTTDAGHAIALTQTLPDTTAAALALSALPESQAAQIVSEPPAADASEKSMTSKITKPEKPFAALTENTPHSETTNNAQFLEKTAKAGQKSILKNTIKKGAPAARPGRVEDDTDVTLLTALIQSNKPPVSAKKPVPKK